MYRAALTAVAAVALIVGGALPAQAAPAAATPGAPTAVKVTGVGGDADVSWSAPRTGPKITGWRVTISPAENQPTHGVDKLKASARTDHFGALTARTTYSFAVRAVGAKGLGPAVTVKHTATGATTDPTVQSLFALNAAGAVVRFPVSGTGAPTTIAAKGAGFTADDRGDVFVPSADLTSIVMYPAGGGAAKTVATGLHLTADLRSDVPGNLYWVDSVSGSIVKLPVTGGAPKTLLGFGAPSASIQRAWGVGRDGTVATQAGNGDSLVVNTASPSGTTTSRTLTYAGGNDTLGYATAVVVDGHGNLYLNERSPGGAGYWGWYLLKPGATVQQHIGTHIAFEYAATNSGTFSLLQSAEWCTSPAEYGTPGGCAIDRSIPNMLVLGSTGSSKTVPVSGITAGSRGANIGAATESGDVYIDIDQAPTAGLWRVPAAGGPAQQVSAAQFTRLLVM
ncbi:fibronectin type III domain protein [Curtobacterium sp. PhB130]|uniref:fibronectin type III domain-containing protein n=1 Tax=unclassified Curtobacterium TaxID=257496 RepID=UPI000FC0BC14|nr:MULTISPECIES: fibronectin type III domain-containing protein [unclassified Curtobacterium]ROS76057.1 fibronectin type III domain protein [Curtobacterium sp. PhB130]TCK64247.1 fibronectin type III domain protein [Curtobacterium sp. PhB136]